MNCCPTTHPKRSSGGGSVLVQSASDELAVDFSTTSAAFVLVTGMSIAMTTGAGFLLIAFAATFWAPDSGGAGAQVAQFEVRLDGVQVIQRGAQATADANTEPFTNSVSGHTRVAVAPGAHTIELFVAVGSGGSNPIQINAAGNPSVHGADMLVQEVTA